MDDNKEFFDLVDKFIEFANQQNEEFSPQRISSALLFAASRYNVWLFSQDKDKPENWKEETLSYFLKQYEAMLKDHLEDPKLQKGE